MKRIGKNWKISLKFSRLLICIAEINLLLTQGARFMSTTMFSAREALIPGSAYDRSKSLVPGPYTFSTNPDFMNPHDPLSYIDPRSRAFNSLNVPIPVPMLMPPAPHHLSHSG